MKKRINILFLIFIGLISFSSFNVSSKEVNSPIKNEQIITSIDNHTLIAAKKSNNVQYDPNLKCEGLLGDPEKDPDSVAWFLVKILNYLKLLGPLMVLVLSSLDFAKAILTSDDESMKKAQSNLITRLLLAAALFVLPVLIEVLLDVFGFTPSDFCIYQFKLEGIK